MSEPTAYPPVGESAGPPVCPRHPDTVAYVRCQRCRRPTCPQCQRPAAVGIQCVDCVAQGAKQVRQGRTVFGGQVAVGRPLVTLTIIGLCAAVFLGQKVVPGLTNDIAFVPALGKSEPWRFLTAAFAHSPTMILHIAFNMYALWIMGTYLEPLLGRARFLAVYLVTALGGSVGYLLLAPPLTLLQIHLGQSGAWITPTVGASGAVFGLFGAFLVLNRRLGRSSAGMVAMIAINAVLGFVIPGIAWQAHLGGLVTGVAAAAIIGYTGHRRDPLAAAATRGNQHVHWLGLGLLTLALVLSSIAKYALTNGYS
ncbi:MAG TPA: rhomboid family intramembrane serine protease [Phycicoccus elongatus]|jgi:membrane associated rhomboid family serine protease|nr:rhomboid family intramembrane serine protease [Tetrasphaera sp.]HOA66942.1 rhomboid family intramembrane serine protease [Phycicoccus elongatus]